MAFSYVRNLFFCNVVFMRYNKLVEHFNDLMIDQDSFQAHDTLQPKIWVVEDILKPDIRKQLLKIVDDFWNGLEVDIDMKDITFTGSLANFNWNPHSDIDLHIVADFEEVEGDPELVRDYFNAAKSLWNQKHKIEIFGYEVEIYVQDDNEEHHSTGVYSLMQNKWLVKPERKTAAIDWQNVQDKANSLMDQIDRLSAMYKDRQYEKAYKYGDRLKEKIRKFRQAGLERIGEYSPENITFKVLRRNDYMGKLVSLRIAAYDAMNSIESTGVGITINETVGNWKQYLNKSGR